MDVARRRAASTAFSLAVLVLVIVFGVVGLLVSHTAISSVQAEAVKAAERAAEAGREKLTAYIWKNVTSTGNITMLTLENRGGVGLSIDRAVAIGYGGQVLSEKALGSPISLGVGERRTMRLDTIFPGYTIYEDVKSTVKTVLFKTLRGSVFGSTYSAPERFEAWLGTTVTGNGTTVTLTQTSGETFTVATTVITTITNVTVVQNVPYWDAEIWIVAALKYEEYFWPSDRRYMFFPRKWVWQWGEGSTRLYDIKLPDITPPSWLLLPELESSGRNILVLPAHVSCSIVRQIWGYRYTGRWEGINSIDPRPVWALGEKTSGSYINVAGYWFTCTYGTCTVGVEGSHWSDYRTCTMEYFYPQTSLKAGNVTIKAPAGISFGEYDQARASYIITYFKLQYYIFYDAWNMSNVLLYGNKSQDTLRVDRPIKGGFVYVLDRVEIKNPPSPPRLGGRVIDVWYPQMCWSDDEELKLTVVKVKVDKESRTVTIDFGTCDTCGAYIAPGPGVYDPNDPRIQECSKSGNVATCKVPEGSIIIIDGDKEE
jgi:hypothetical protein